MDHGDMDHGDMDHEDLDHGDGTPPGPDAPAVLTLARQEAALIGIVVPRPDMPTVMGPAVAELMQVLRGQGIVPSGPLFAHHRRMDPAVFDFALGFPVDRTVAASGRVVPGHLPAARVARAVHRGPYEGLPGAWGAFRRWIAGRGHACADDLWEVYATGPGTEPDPARWRTELVQPLAG